MSREEVLQKIEQLELKMFMLEMQDRWTEKTHQESNRLSNEVKQLRKKI